MTFDKGGSWPTYLPELVSNYNQSWHSSIGTSPVKLWVAPKEEREAAMEKAGLRSKQSGLKRFSRQKFKVGDEILLYDAVAASAKEEFLQPLWRGPYKLVERLSGSCWKYGESKNGSSINPLTVRVVHESHMQHYDDLM